ncbi:hypothetical protein KL921_000214 [Ogataea angusta]|uniref:Transmembrane protein n=1 Tax=Pichia angusta TaxID=870730 RepID=A0ABQ7S1W9_PICAN|nr:hypothetical protein KL921_000214 [Ogataea angusta]KAG7831452.1 hypothetical protein KL920_000972 [Ogataea angusta]KAG7837394.1 hypothetical protein KL943_001433 [Ogataea angusta]KAG7842230.1 hypothetical protein KL942_000968 [Ogataea angusta]KAG7851975.1 hypothetical protein KL940_000857 [Ogataea angusta]
MFRSPFLLIRRQSTQRQLTQRLSILEKLVHNDITSFAGSNGSKVPPATAFEILRLCKLFQDSVHETKKTNVLEDELIVKSNALMQKVFLAEKVDYSQALLTDFLKLKPHVASIKFALTCYYMKNTNKVLKVETAMIPLRNLLYDAKFQEALDVIELTTGFPRYYEFKSVKWRRMVIKFFAGIGGTIGAMDLSFRFLLPGFFQSNVVYGLYGAVGTFLANAGFMAMMAFSTKGQENGALRFEKGTLPATWYKKVDQMKMCAMVLECDAEINGREGFASRPVVERIHKMGFVVNEPEQEIMLRQYWVSSGEGFVWCEPDLDPADIEWWQHLEKIGVKKIWDKDYEQLDQQPEQQHELRHNTPIKR